MENILMSEEMVNEKSAKRSRHSLTLQNNIPLVGLAAVLLLFAIITKGKSLGPANLLLIFQQSLVLLICSTGVFFVMTMGGLDFSQGAIIGVASIAFIVAGQQHLFLGILAGCAVGLGIGLINGVIHVKGKVGSFIVTICSMLAFRGVCALLTTKAPYSAPTYIYLINSWTIYLPIVIGVLAVGWIISSGTKLGRQIRAIGSGEVAARYSGIKVGRIKMFAFAFAGLLAGLAATVNVFRVGSITASAGALTETNVMIALVLGGLPVTGGAKTSFLSVLSGVFILSILNNGLALMQIEPNVQQFIRGIIFLAIVAITTDRKSTGIIK